MSKFQNLMSLFSMPSPAHEHKGQICRPPSSIGGGTALAFR